MEEYSEAFVAFDVAKKKHAVALAEGPRWGTPVASYVAEPIRPTPAL